MADTAVCVFINLKLVIEKRLIILVFVYDRLIDIVNIAERHVIAHTTNTSGSISALRPGRNIKTEHLCSYLLYFILGLILMLVNR